MTNTARFAIAKPADSDLIVNGAVAIRTIADGFDAITTGYSSGVFASRPAAGTRGRVYLATDVVTSDPNGTLYFDNGTTWDVLSGRYSQGTLAARPAAGHAGRFYFATNDTTSTPNGTLYFDDGTAWDQVQIGPATSLSTTLNTFLGLSDSATRRGKSIISTSESRTNTAYGLLATPDIVSNVVLPGDGLIVVAYQATWKESVLGAAAADIFLGPNAVTSGIPGVNAQVGRPASINNNTLVGQDVLLGSSFGGLASYQGISGGGVALYGGDVTTGQYVGGGFVQPSGAGAILVGGPCFIFAAAGTYDISVRFKASSGSVTVKNRKLWVWTIGF